MERITAKLVRAFVVLLLCAAAVTTASSQVQPQAIDVTALAARGEAIAKADPDPLAVELRNREPAGSSGRRGFYIGMAVAEGQTLPGPGKDRFGNSLSRAEQGAFRTAVSFSVDRKRNADLARTGAVIAKADPIVAAARTVDQDVLYWLGFDIATGIFGDPALGAQGKTAKGPGSLGIRDLLSDRAKSGFNASMEFHLRKYQRTSGAAVVSGVYTDSIKAKDLRGAAAVLTDLNSPATRVGENSAGAAAVILATRPPSNEIRCRGGHAPGFRGLYFETVGSRVDSSGETILTISLRFQGTAFWVDRDYVYEGRVNPEPHWFLGKSGCTWLDSRDQGPYRPISHEAPDEIRFETPANAQLKQKRHGSAVDTSPTAAERYPDARTIPAYLSEDPNHYWSFVGVTQVTTFFVATGHGYWKPGLKVGSLRGFKREQQESLRVVVSEETRMK